MRHFSVDAIRSVVDLPMTKHWLLQSDRMRAATLIMQPGYDVPTHAHTMSEEVFVILAGKGVATIDGVTVEVVAGDALVTADGETHTFRVTGDQAMVLLAINAPNLDDTLFQSDAA